MAKGIETNEKTIWYLCDGEKQDCKKTHCYKNTDIEPCRHTRDIEHAINFRKEEPGGRENYWENNCDTSNTAVEKDLRNKS